MTTSSCKASETDAPSSPRGPPNGLTWVSPESMIPVSAPDYGQLRLLRPMPLTVQVSGEAVEGTWLTHPAKAVRKAATQLGHWVEEKRRS